MPDNGNGGGQGSGTNANGGTGGTGQGSGSQSYVVTTQQGGSGGGSATEESPRERKQQGSQTIADRFVSRFGDERRAIEALAGELYDMREERRELAARVAQLPPTGAVVLVGPDVTAWNEFRALNLPVDKVKERLANEARLAAETSRATTGTLAQQAGQAVGWPNTAALADLISDKQIQVELRDVQVLSADGKTSTPKKVPYARKATDANGAYIPLTDYVATNHGHFLAALTATPQGGTQQNGQAGTSSATGGTQGGTSGTGNGTQQQATNGNGGQGSTGTVVVVGDGGQQSGTGGQQQSGSLVDRMLQANQKAATAPNALRPKTGA
jgi:hypothetical protein